MVSLSAILPGHVNKVVVVRQSWFIDNMCQIQYERPYCIGYTMSSRRRDILYPIQYGREYCIVLMKWKARFYLPLEGNSHILVSGTIEVRTLYCAYEMKSTLTFARTDWIGLLLHELLMNFIRIKNFHSACTKYLSLTTADFKSTQHT